MNVAGIDLAWRRTGVVLLDHDTGNLADTLIVERPSDWAGSDGEWLRTLARDIAFTVTDALNVGLEAPLTHNAGAAIKLLMCHGAVRARLAPWHDPLSPAVTTIKKLATGNGRADKGAMIQAAVDRWGVDVDDPDLADAAWVAEWTRLRVIANASPPRRPRNSTRFTALSSRTVGMLAERDAARTERDALRQALVTWYGSWTDDSQCDVLAKHIPDNNWGLTP